MIFVTEIEHEGGACPYQLEGKTDKGESIYVRYRWGTLLVEVNNEVVIRKFLGEDQDDEVELQQMQERGKSEEHITSVSNTFKMMRELDPGNPVCFDGYLTFEELKEATKDEIQWPDGF